MSQSARAVRLLVIEDDAAIRASLRLALEDEGYVACDAETGEDGLREFEVKQPDLVLLDLTLPGMDGFDTCRAIRRLTNAPIIIVTARHDTHDVVAGLEAGADDYVTKPFVTKELAARIRAALRRMRGEQGPATAWTFGDLEIRPEEGVVRVDGSAVELTRTEFRLICELAASPGRVLSREQLLERVWSYDYFGDSRLVDVHVRRLRTKIEKDPAQPQHVVTVRGLGYKLVS